MVEGDNKPMPAVAVLSKAAILGLSVTASAAIKPLTLGSDCLNDGAAMRGAVINKDVHIFGGNDAVEKVFCVPRDGVYAGV